MNVRKATIEDLSTLVEFTSREAEEAEGSVKERDRLQIGIRAALEDPSIATYWILVDESNNPIASISALREWSDWNAGYYWWIQSMYVAPAYRGKGHLETLLGAVLEAARAENALELRLYVHKENRVAVRAYKKAGFSASPYLTMSRPI